jgi:hypothetical protein
MSLPWRRVRVAAIVTTSLLGGVARAQIAQDQSPPPPLVIGRDPREATEVIGKNFLLRVWLTNVGGPGMQRIYSLRVGADGMVTMPGILPLHAEGVPIATLEQQALALYRATWPTATLWVSVAERGTPPPPPPPPPATAPATPPAPPPPPATAPATPPATPPATQPATKPATQPAATKAVATSAPATTAPAAVKKG